MSTVLTGTARRAPLGMLDAVAVGSTAHRHDCPRCGEYRHGAVACVEPYETACALHAGTPRRPRHPAAPGSRSAASTRTRTFTTAEAARRIPHPVSPDELNRLAARGLVWAPRVGRYRRWTRTAISEAAGLLARHEPGGRWPSPPGKPIGRAGPR